MKKKIIVVDDNHDFIYMLKRGLERLSEDYEIIGVESGKECFDLFKSNLRPSLILLDIMMPEIDGWDVFARIKQNPEWKHIPIVFLTAKTDAFSNNFGNMAAQAYVQKPFELQDLKEKIDEILTVDTNHAKRKIDSQIDKESDGRLSMIN